MTFEGPLFIVGMSRSGNKLVRHILNRHPLIGIPDYEFHFIARYAYACRKLNWRPDRRLRQSILQTFLRRHYMRPDVLRGPCLDEGKSADIVMDPNNTYQDILKYLMTASVTPTSGKSDFIWGERTPTNLNHVKVLKEAFPSARFVHIIRDPRDRALSVRHAWGGNIFMVSEKWRRSISLADGESKKMKNHFLTIKYEDLTHAPRRVLKLVCDFLGLQFSKRMLTLEWPVERLGDSGHVGDSGHATRTKSEIIPNNTKKYLTELSPNEIRRIEEIVYPVAKKFGYDPITSNVEFIPLSIGEKLAYGMLDDFRNCTSAYKRWGFLKGTVDTLHKIAERANERF